MHRRVKIEFILRDKIVHKVSLPPSMIRAKIPSPPKQTKNTFKIPKDLINKQKKKQIDFEISLSNSENSFIQESSEMSNSEEEDMQQSQRLTKRQLMKQNANNFFEELPEKKGRKKRKLQEDDPFVKQEKEIKRREQLQKQIEEQKYEVVNRILNDAGRKQKLRKEKEELNQTSKTRVRTPQDGPIITYISNKEGNKLILDKDINIFYEK